MVHLEVIQEPTRTILEQHTTWADAAHEAATVTAKVVSSEFMLLWLNLAQLAALPVTKKMMRTRGRQRRHNSSIEASEIVSSPLVELALRCDLLQPNETCCLQCCGRAK